MSIAILFESHEWSSFALAENLRQSAPEIRVKLYDLETEVELEDILSHHLIVNRIFASAYFRGHERSLDQIKLILQRANELGKVLLNSYEAHFYEIDKYFTAQVLARQGLPVPAIYGCLKTEQGPDSLHPVYPCIIKPNCGGRTMDTYVLHSPEQLTELWPRLNPAIEYLVEAYILPKAGFITRIEFINGRCVQILKKTLNAEGLAAYHLGSKFYPYPECPGDVKNIARRTMELLQIEMGSLDMIESEEGPYIIDVNSVSNTSEDCIAAFDYDLLAEMAQFIVNKHRLLKEIS